ncbi:MAG: hypothetical protein E7554_11245 [Ruminococcaceae bacterium]|nr:hypothetical protein [Oscillospiraceae bacterium]
MPSLLPYEIYYENSAGDVLRLDRPPFVVTSCRLFDSSWKLTRSQRPLGEGGSLLARRRPADERTMTVQAVADDSAGLAAALIRMSEVFDYDVIARTSGRLWVNGSYQCCWCSGSVKELSCDFPDRAQLTVTVCPEQPAWCTERSYRILGGDTVSDPGGHGYPYSYPYRYGTSRRSISLVNTHFAPAPMRITLYGPAQEPRVYVGDSCIGVNTPLHAGERVLIDQQNKLITRTGTDGVSFNCFGDRIKNGQTFDYAPPGSTVIDLYSETLGVDIVLVEQRSEPSWVCV